MRTIKNILLLITLLLSTYANAGETKPVSPVTAAKQFLIKEKVSGFTTENTVRLFAERQDIPETWLVNLNPEGFVVVSIIKNKAVINGYSFDNDFVLEGNTERTETVLSILEEAVLVNQNDSEHPEAQRSTKNVNVLYGPYVHTMWGQVNCHDINGNLINVTNIYTPNHYAVGCVAVSQSTIQHHYQWPPKGVGSYTDNDNSGNSHGSYTAKFDTTQYRWDLMLERYRGKTSTVEQREAAGLLAYHAAIALRMDFESDGSTSNVNRIPSALANYFRFTALYRSKSSSTFWSLLDSNMVYKKPAVLAVENSSGGGHSVVCDGLKIDEEGNYFYHLNMGWWGNTNGWYKIRGSFDAGGYNRIIGAAMNIIPEPMIEEPVIDSDSIEFDLTWSYPEKAEAEAFQVQKRINNGDWITISDDITDTALHILVDPEKEYDFRVRAKTNGKWYQNSWSAIAHLKRTYVGTEEFPENAFKCYPNPFNKYLHIDFDKALSGELRIFNAAGEEVYRGKVNGNQINLETGNWDKGIYIIRLVQNNSTVSFKAIKI